MCARKRIDLPICRETKLSHSEDFPTHRQDSNNSKDSTLKHVAVNDVRSRSSNDGLVSLLTRHSAVLFDVMERDTVSSSTVSGTVGFYFRGYSACCATHKSISSVFPFFLSVCGKPRATPQPPNSCHRFATSGHARADLDSVRASHVLSWLSRLAQLKCSQANSIFPST
jgi:hypothetical protein